MAPIAAEFADRTNLLGNDDDALQRLAEAVRTQADACGRSGDSVVMGRLFQVLFTDDIVAPGDREAVLTKRAAEIGVEAEELLAYHHHVPSYIGPPDGAAQAILDRTVQLGMSEVVLNIDTVGMLDYQRTMDGVRLFAADVLGALRSH
jgi:alkanesulfonate monooxygenase SsuD/methylene tetrahydromethanopterin reductase-like flavin-dependent oxidoreductase (luciferase family)